MYKVKLLQAEYLEICSNLGRQKLPIKSFPSCYSDTFAEILDRLNGS